MTSNPINGNPGGAEALNGAIEKLRSGTGGKAGGDFEALLSETIGKVASLQKETEKAISELGTGKGDIVEAMVAMQKADISFQVMIEVRNKLVSAYEEIMRMQV